MSNILLEFTRNSIWQAFSSLTDPNELNAPKSRLRVFVASLGTILDCSGVDKGLEDFRSTPTLNFSEFEYYLSREVFSSISSSINRAELSLAEEKIDELCWTLAKSKFNTSKKEPSLDSETTFKLFRIFSLLSDLVRDDEGNAQVLLSPEEADLVFTKLIKGVTKDWETKEDFECLFSNAIFDFPTFLSVIELKFLKEFQRGEVIEVIHHLYDEFVDDIIKKGSLLKRGRYLPKYVEKLFTLRPWGLFYHTKNPKKPKILKFDSQTRVVEAQLKGNEKSKFFVFYVITSNRVQQLATLDKRYRSQWLSSLKLAISRYHCQDSYGRFLRNKRRLEWHRTKLRRQVEIERTNELLRAEKMAREAAERMAVELGEQKRVEEAEKEQLDEIRKNLEKLLADEIQAKRDEEMVRSIQGRLLSEEWERREELEKLQEEQRQLLDMERNKTKNCMKKQAELERQLEQAEQKLRELERYRGEMDLELDAARTKNAERNREILETRLKLFSAPLVDDEKIKRARRSVSMREGKHQQYYYPNYPTSRLPPINKLTFNE